jgi:hypothetical protein
MLEVFMVVKMWTVVLWVMTLCSVVGGYKHFRRTYHLHLRAEDGVPLKHRYLFICPHSVTTQKTNTDFKSDHFED